MIEIRIGAGNIDRWRRRGMIALLCLFLGWMAYVVRNIWLPLMIAFLIAMVLDPLVDRMEARGWSRIRSVLLIYVLFFTVLTSMLTLAVPAVIQQTQTITKSLGNYLPIDAASANDKIMRKHLNRLMDKLHAAPFIRSSVDRARSQISGAFNSARGWLGRVAQAAVGNMLWIVIIPLVSFYALKDLHLIYARLLLLVAREHRGTAQNFLNEVSSIFVRYLRGLTIVCALNGLATMLILMLFQVPNPLGLGAISGVLYCVPYLGPILTYLLVGTVSLTAGTPTLLILAILVILHSIVFDQIITPRVLGQHVGLHPILSIVALLVGGSLLGILGMLLAVPLAATLQSIILAFFPRLRASVVLPSGEQWHQRVDDTTVVRSTEETSQMAEAHQEIVAAVDTAEEEEARLEQSGEAHHPFTSVAPQSTAQENSPTRVEPTKRPAHGS